MARDGTIETGKIIEMLMKLPIDSRVAVNELGNMVCYGADKYLGYIDVIAEKFHTISELAYEMLERDDDGPEAVAPEAEPEDLLSEFRKVYRNRK